MRGNVIICMSTDVGRAPPATRVSRRISDGQLVRNADDVLLFSFSAPPCGP